MKLREEESITRWSASLYAALVFTLVIAGAGQAGSQATGGYSLVLPAPAGATASYGACLSLAAGAGGDPALAFFDCDLDRDGRGKHGAVCFTRWDRAASGWTRVRELARTGPVELRGGRRQLSLASETSDSGRVTLAVAYQADPYRLDIAVSRDNGATWSARPIEDAGDRPVDQPSLSLRAGVAHLAFYEDKRVWYCHGAVDSDPSKWAREELPLLPHTRHAHPSGVTLAMDGEGRPAVAYFLESGDRTGLTAALWRPGRGAVRITDTRGVHNEAADMSLRFSGGRAVIAIAASREPGGSQLWVASAEDTATSWAEPASPGSDGGAAIGGHIALAIGPAGEVLLAAERTGGDPSAEQCGEPKLLRAGSRQGEWTACSPDVAVDRRFQAAWPAALWTEPGEAVIAVQNRNPGARLGAGIVVWRGR